MDAAFADVLQLLAFVALVNINDIMQKRMRKLVKSPKDIKSANDIYIKLFGDFEFITDKGTLTADDVERSSTVLFLSYLAIRHKEKLPSYLMDELLSEEGTAKRTVYNIVSQARKDLQPLQKTDLLPTARNSGGYHFNPIYNIITDLDRFDELYNNIMEGGSTPRNYLNCVQMMELYEDDIQLDSENEAINNIIRHYRSRFLEVVEKMIHILYESRLYNDIRQVVDKGLKVEPCKNKAYDLLKIGKLSSIKISHSAVQVSREPRHSGITPSCIWHSAVPSNAESFPPIPAIRRTDQKQTSTSEATTTPMS